MMRTSWRAGQWLASLRKAAAHVLGVRRVQFLGYEDGELEDTRGLRRAITDHHLEPT